MDLREFSKKLAMATEHMSDSEKESVRQLFEKVQDQLNKEDNNNTNLNVGIQSEGTEIPDGPTQRLVDLKANFLKQVPTITLHRAKIVTELTR
ncbi:MAG: formate C-acetyltransferase/glycerol dehydratase family glycyl radical enzyme, partial [Clostridioides difficile]|nr:formate C-acetyltransferase/glycerol dehydratase family glycyl radical enzyme [Clostridioides difficile]